MKRMQGKQLSLWDEPSQLVPTQRAQPVEMPRKCIKGDHCINEQTGLHNHALLLEYDVDRRQRAHMMEIAESLNWPQVKYWDYKTLKTVVPVREVWELHNSHGACGHLCDLVEALERVQRGEPLKKRRYESYEEDNE